jgi:hypothetical protein
MSRKEIIFRRLFLIIVVPFIIVAISVSSQSFLHDLQSSTIPFVQIFSGLILLLVKPIDFTLGAILFNPFMGQIPVFAIIITLVHSFAQILIAVGLFYGFRKIIVKKNISLVNIIILIFSFLAAGLYVMEFLDSWYGLISSYRFSELLFIAPIASFYGKKLIFIDKNKIVVDKYFLITLCILMLFATFMFIDIGWIVVGIPLSCILGFYLKYSSVKRKIYSA